MHYVGTLAEMEAIAALIDSNAGVPEGGNVTWDEPKETITADSFAVITPYKTWNGRTKEQLKAGITDAEVENVEFPVGEDV